MKKIVVVDDNEQSLYMLQVLLSGSGYAVTAAANGAEALEKARSGLPDMIISDILMPVMDGFQLCRAWKRDKLLKDVPFVFYTATYTDPKDEEFGLGLGAERFIVKPIEPDVFLCILEDVFDAQKAGRSAAPRQLQSDEGVYMKEYNEVIIRKLEDKMVQVEEANRRLEREVAERERTEKELRESEERFRNIFEHSTVGKSLMAPDGILLQINRAFADMLGYAVEEMQRINFADITHPEDIAASRECIRCLLANERITYQMEKRYIHRNGNHIWAYVSTVLLRDNNGSPRYFITSIMDITERKQLEEQLQQAMKMEAIGRLAGGVAHDFNNALTPIMAISGILLRDLNPGHPMYKDIKAIEEAGERCANLTRQLLAFGRRQPLEMKVLKLNEVVINMEKMLSHVIGEDIKLIKFLQPELGNVKADVSHMEQIIANLAVNARDAMPHGGKLIIETKNVDIDEEYVENHVGLATGPHVMLAVSDTGEGMDEKTRLKVFEPFFTTKEKGKGTGLGLSTVYGIVKQSGGNIGVYSEQGKGTTFKVYLPRVLEQADKIKPHKRILHENYIGSETILLVEDDESVRNASKRILERKGYKVVEAINAEEAIKVCHKYKKKIDLMVTDVVMTGMSGRELAEKLTSQYPNMKVLYISGYTDNAIVQHGILEEGIHFIQKPFTILSLTHKIREVIDGN